jgi:TolA-binding protein
VIEARNLVIKTDNLLKSLHAEVKQVGKRQDDFQKRSWVSSGVAYGLFAALCIGGAILVSAARSSSANGERDRLEKQLAELTTQTDKLKAESQANAQAQRSANDIYQMMTRLPGDERLKGIDELAKLDTTRLSPLEKQSLTDRADLLRKEVGQSTFERGKQNFRKQDFKAAVEDLSRYMAMNPPQEDALDAAFFLGASLAQVRKPDEAIPHLSKFITEDKRSKTRDYAMLLLAQSYEATNQFDKAIDTARDALGTYPSSEFTSQLKTRLVSAKRALANAPPAAEGGTGGAADAAATPTTPAGRTAEVRAE